MDELSEEDKITVARARKIQRFLSQPFQVRNRGQQEALIIVLGFHCYLVRCSVGDFAGDRKGFMLDWAPTPASP